MRWNTESITASTRKKVEEKTEGWTSEQLREALINVIAASYPLTTTMTALGDNPTIPRGGMTVSSGLFPERTDDIDEDHVYVYDPDVKKMVAIPMIWDEPQPDDVWLAEASFDAGVELHPETPILTVVQSAVAASIFRGSFCLEDVNRLADACRLEQK